MSLTYGFFLPQALARNHKDPIAAFETMTSVAQAADEYGYESVWVVDHFHTAPYASWALLQQLSW
jgi:alkanesulfonate monooxygenase SsuD/methylene tetrahydromethanopterin reductase-like flavin-dependent oxidoreductase (luciferase family)